MHVRRGHHTTLQMKISISELKVPGIAAGFTTTGTGVSSKSASVRQTTIRPIERVEDQVKNGV